VVLVAASSCPLVTYNQHLSVLVNDRYKRAVKNLASVHHMVYPVSLDIVCTENEAAYPANSVDRCMHNLFEKCEPEAENDRRNEGIKHRSKSVSEIFQSFENVVFQRSSANDHRTDKN
jgi:hypothetical protein